MVIIYLLPLPDFSEYLLRYLWFDIGKMHSHRILMPIMPLFWHPTKMQVMTARHFGALKMALWKLSTTYSGSISAILDKTFYLSWSHYTDSFNDVQQFECDKIQKPSERLFFFFGRAVE